MARIIDIIAVAPSGVFVIDCKRYKGKTEVANPTFGQATLRINGRNRTKLLDGLGRQVAAVRSALGEAADETPVHGRLCFVAPEGLLTDIGLPILRTVKINGYPLYYPKRLARQLKNRGLLTAERARLLQAELADRLPPALSV